jgi:hypothetical protein
MAFISKEYYLDMPLLNLTQIAFYVKCLDVFSSFLPINICYRGIYEATQTFRANYTKFYIEWHTSLLKVRMIIKMWLLSLNLFFKEVFLHHHCHSKSCLGNSQFLELKIITFFSFSDRWNICYFLFLNLEKTL